MNKPVDNAEQLEPAKINPELPALEEQDAGMATFSMIKKQKMRSTYTKLNAELFRPLFDAVLKDGREKTLPYASFRLSPQTLYVKICDALKYLIEREENETLKNSYLILKASFKIRAEKDGVTLRARWVNQPNIAEMTRNAIGVHVIQGVIIEAVRDVEEIKRSDAVSNVGEEAIRHWKDLITAFVNNTVNEESIEEVTFNSPLSDNEKIWIADVFNGVPNMDFLFIDQKTLKMAKVKI